MQSEKTKLLLPDPEEMGKIDRLTAQIIPVMALMENAGWVVVSEIMQHYRSCKVLVLCGPGNNGGDGYVVARLLAKAGWPVRVAAFIPPKTGEAKQAALEWRHGCVPCNKETVAEADLVVDAVFGAGLSRDLEPALITLFEHAKHVVSIDVPSGIDGASGVVKGYAPHAELTVTFCRAKPGHYLLPGTTHVGKLVVADIGIPEHVISEIPVSCYLNEPGLWRIPTSATDDYKYHRGIVSVIGGSEMTGAGRLSSLAASSCGAGLVHIFAFGKTDVYLMSSPCFMIDSNDLSLSLQDERRKVWVCGPGLVKKEVENALPKLIKAGKKIVADAGALQKDFLGLLAHVDVITPHIGEFTRLFGKIASCKLTAAKQAAKALDTVVVLKGPDTIIAAPDGRVAINRHADSRLATAGSGDVLTGIVATFLACGMPVWEAACAAVWVHGESAILCHDSWPNALNLIGNLGQARDNAGMGRTGQE